MKKLSRYTLFLTAAFIVLTSLRPGGDVYEIYLGNDRLVQHFVHGEKAVPVIKINSASATQYLAIFYNHCGRLGNNRSITFTTKDASIKKSWRFADAAPAANLAGGSKFMKVNTTEILQLKKMAGKNKLEIFYYSTEIPEGKLLAMVE